MNSDRGWYLVAIGVLALGITNSSLGGSARGLLDRAAGVADHVSAQVVQAVAVAQLMSDRGDAGWAHTQTALAKAHLRMAEGRSNCGIRDRMDRAIMSPSQEDLDQDLDLR